MASPAFEKWKLSGKLFLWTYLENKKNYPGWNLSLDNSAVISLLDLLKKMNESKWPSSKSIVVCPPSKKILKGPNNRDGRAKCYSPKSFRIKYNKDSVPPRYWNLELLESCLTLSVGHIKLDELRKSIEDINNGLDDYSIGPDDLSDSDSRLWFWGTLVASGTGTLGTLLK
jgi:hypothetical protein